MIIKCKSFNIKKHRLDCIALTICVALVLSLLPAGECHQVEAASINTFSSTKKSIVCGNQAKIKIPSGYNKVKFTSSNKKVATVSSKGVVKAERLGVAKITAKSGNKRKIYTITVKPEKSSDVWLNQEAILTNQTVQLKLESDKYDTSQVKLSFDCGYSEVNADGLCSGVEFPGCSTLNYSYGSFKKSIELASISPEWIVGDVLGKYSLEDDPSEYDVDAGKVYEIELECYLETGALTPTQLREKGISLLLDGEPLQDEISYVPGLHMLSIKSGDLIYQQEFFATYPIKETIIYKDATGYPENCKKVFDAAFSIVNQVIQPGMGEDEKAKAIHDYLIYHANYANNGDLSMVENWVYGAEGVLLHKEGVCNSYAIAFYIMTTAAGLDCRYVEGWDGNSGHAWNKVKVDGTWYYVDCTWDDPILNGHSGGAENHRYFLSEQCWNDHLKYKDQCIKDLSEDGKYLWINYYLTGESYIPIRFSYKN